MHYRHALLALLLTTAGCMMPATRPPDGGTGDGNRPGRPIADAVLLTQCRLQVTDKMRDEIGLRSARQVDGRIIRSNDREWLAGGEMDVTARGPRPERYSYVCSIDVADRYRIASATYSRR